jgi:DMSO/TMAO reductase YedYZ molybdopterin-dependent catalytic subunit
VTATSVGTSTTSEPSLRTRARIAGVVAAAVALGVGELVSAFGEHGQSLVGGVGNEVVDRAAGGAVRWAIDVFGTADKAVLVVAIVVISLVLGAWVGRLSLSRRWVGPVAFSVFGALGMIAGLRDPLSSKVVVLLAAVSAVLAGIVTLFVLLHVARTGHAITVAAPRAIERPGDDKASRRAFFGWAGAAGAFAATAAVAARSLTSRTNVEAARQLVTLPPATTPLGEPGVAVGDRFAVEGLAPYVTPNADFYRIDTALVVPQVDVTTWSLAVKGLVDQPFELTYDELVAMSTTEEVVTLSCVSNEVGGSLVGNARWQGVPLQRLLERAGVQADGTQIVGRSVDGFTAGFPIEAAYDGRVALIAVGMNGEPLPVRHGYPARLVVAGLYGYVSATKWLSEIQLTRWDDFDGYWIPRGWSKEGPVKTQSRIDVPRVGAQVVPGTVPIAGVAWAPTRGITKVEVQIDDGPWQPAELGDTVSDNTWVQWMLPWNATPGDHELRVRTTDGTGELQTSDVAPPDPNGATGWHTRRVRVSES